MNGRAAPVVPLTARILGAVFGFAFAGIGLTVLGFLWFGDDGFGSPPLIFKLVGSFIATVFVAMGGTMGFSALAFQGKSLAAPAPSIPTHSTSVTSPHSNFAPGHYTCPHCAAPLASGVEASPHGDIKCPFCGAWFNIHQRSI